MAHHNAQCLGSRKLPFKLIMSAYVFSPKNSHHASFHRPSRNTRCLHRGGWRIPCGKDGHGCCVDTLSLCSSEACGHVNCSLAVSNICSERCALLHLCQEPYLSTSTVHDMPQDVSDSRHSASPVTLNAAVLWMKDASDSG